METFDWIVVGAGITGAALSYELAKQGLTVLLLDRAPAPHNASRFGYGGIAYWSGTTALTRQLCTEGIEIHRSLGAELDADTQFRELDLVMPIPAAADPIAISQTYAGFAIPPQLLDVPTACQLEPLLNPAVLSGALTVKHGHVNNGETARAYRQAAQRHGCIEAVNAGNVTQLLRQSDRIVGVDCGGQVYQAANVVICAGAWSRSLLQAAGIRVPVYFTHAELIETPPVEVTLRSLVMPALTERFNLEAKAATPELEPLWDQPGQEPAPAILDPGAIQFRDRSLRIGQISRTLTGLHPAIDAAASEAALRQGIGEVLPDLRDLPGTWYCCQVAYSRDQLPIVGAIPGIAGLHLFSGFSNPLTLVPPLARRFAAQATGTTDALLVALSPDRFRVSVPLDNALPSP